MLSRTSLALVAVALAATLSPGETFAGDEDGGPLPLNPFEKAEPGEWSCLAGTLRSKEAAEDGKTLAHSTVVKVENDEVTVEESGGDVRDRAKKTFSKKTAPSVAAFFGLEGGVSAPKVTDEKRKVGEKEFSCKKLAFTWKKTERLEYAVSAWLSTEVKGGLVAVTMDGTETDGAIAIHPRIELELAGFGTRDGVDWSAPGQDDVEVQVHPPLELGTLAGLAGVAGKPAAFEQVKPGQVYVHAIHGKGVRLSTETTIESVDKKRLRALVRRLSAEGAEIEAHLEVLPFDGKPRDAVLRIERHAVKSEKLTVSGVELECEVQRLELAGAPGLIGVAKQPAGKAWVAKDRFPFLIKFVNPGEKEPSIELVEIREPAKEPAKDK